MVKLTRNVNPAVAKFRFTSQAHIILLAPAAGCWMDIIIKSSCGKAVNAKWMMSSCWNTRKTQRVMSRFAYVYVDYLHLYRV